VGVAPSFRRLLIGAMTEEHGKDPQGSRVAGILRHRSVKWLLSIFVAIVLLYSLRHPLLRAVGDFLIVEDPVEHADVICVLGGAAVDRGEEAARLYKRGVSDRIICTGESVPGDLEAMGLPFTESDCCARVVIDNGVPAERVEAFKVGTSTIEEAIALVDRAKHDGVDTVMVVSNSFHLRRIAYVFRHRFADAHITLLLHGAPSHDFSTDRWWRKEAGLMMVNNEYVKLLWYHLKY
jgi:uncharacterized SAM-binding protein YcdF (DUF218 family)